MSDLEDAGEPELNAAAIVEVLNRHQVRDVIIGAFAAIAQQARISARWRGAYPWLQAYRR